MIADHGVFAGVREMRVRFADCKAAAVELAQERGEDRPRKKKRDWWAVGDCCGGISSPGCGKGGGGKGTDCGDLGCDLDCAPGC